MIIGIEESFCGGDVETGTGFSTRVAVSESEGNSRSIKKNNNYDSVHHYTCTFLGRKYWVHSHLPSDMIFVIALQKKRDNYSLYGK